MSISAFEGTTNPLLADAATITAATRAEAVAIALRKHLLMI